MHVNSHALPCVNSICLLYIAWCGFRLSCYNTTLDPDKAAPQLWWLRALTIFSHFVCRSTLYLQGNQLQQLPAGVFSNLTSLRSLTCVVECIENVCVHVCVELASVWHDRQLKTTLHFRGRVNNNACEQSCTTLCHLYLASAPCTLMVTMALLACVCACW